GLGSATGTQTRTSVRPSSGGGGAARPGGPCCAASPGSTWSGWATRQACSSSTGPSWQGARRGATAGKSCERPPSIRRSRPRLPQLCVAAPRLRTVARRPARTGTSGANRHFRREPLLPVRTASTVHLRGLLSAAAEPSSAAERLCRHSYTMERPDKAALNALQPPEFRNESSLASTLKTLLFFTALMITVPIGLYFTTKSYIFEGALGMSNRDSYFYAAIVAVVAVHVVLALFVYVAWNEGSRQWREGKQD
uniref:Vacuolar ATPase assembly factor VMA21 n=1 Tax=Macaca mulatta TaxID=9544 RepID=A0A5F7ZIR4_MACMU